MDFWGPLFVALFLAPLVVGFLLDLVGARARWWRWWFPPLPAVLLWLGARCGEQTTASPPALLAVATIRGWLEIQRQRSWTLDALAITPAFAGGLT